VHESIARRQGKLKAVVHERYPLENARRRTNMQHREVFGRFMLSVDERMARSSPSSDDHHPSTPMTGLPAERRPPLLRLAGDGQQAAPILQEARPDAL